MALKSFVDGDEGEAFFQKRAPPASLGATPQRAPVNLLSQAPRGCSVKWMIRS